MIFTLLNRNNLVPVRYWSNVMCADYLCIVNYYTTNPLIFFVYASISSSWCFRLVISVVSMWWVEAHFINTLRPLQNGCHFAYVMFNCILYDNFLLLSFNRFLMITIGLCNGLAPNQWYMGPEMLYNNIRPRSINAFRLTDSGRGKIKAKWLAWQWRQAIIWTNDGKHTDAYMPQSASIC